MNKNNSIGEVVAIYIQDKKGEPYKSISEGTLKKNQGLLGDIHSIGDSRQISIFSTEGIEELSSLKIQGLCTQRWHENIRVKNLDMNNLKVGSNITIGDTIQQITEIGKRCFPECKIVKAGKVCALSTQIIFTKVIKGGKIIVGDELQ